MPYTTQGTQTDAGVIQYDPNNGRPLVPGQTVEVAPGGNTYGSTPKMPTIVSSVAGEKIFNQDKTDLSNHKADIATFTSAAPKAPVAKTDQQIVNELSSAPKTPAQIEADQAEESRQAAYDSLILANTGQTKALKDQLTTTYQENRKNLEALNATTNALVERAGMRSGQARYSPEINAGIVADEARIGLEKLQELDSKYNNAISAADAALATGNATVLNQKLIEANKYKQDALDQFNKNLESAKKMNQELIDADKKTKIDYAIDTIVAGGVTDAASIFKQLSDAGYPVTNKMVKDSLAELSPNGDLEKLSGATRDFFILKGLKKLPSSITSLPDGQQLFAYLKQEKDASTATKVPGTGASKNKITWSEATTRGLPISVVGMSEQDIIDSFNDEAPPAWFQEKVQNERQQSLPTETIKPLWDEFRAQAQSGKKPSATTKTSTDKKPTAKVIGTVRALRAKGAPEQDITDYINYSGYNPDDPAFK